MWCFWGGGGGIEKRLLHISRGEYRYVMLSLAKVSATLPLGMTADMISVTLLAVQLFGKQPDHLTTGMCCKVKPEIIKGKDSNPGNLPPTSFPGPFLREEKEKFTSNLGGELNRLKLGSIKCFLKTF